MLNSPQTGARLLPVIRCCNRAWRSNRPVRIVRSFRRIFAGNTGFDLYSLAVSDVYQDLFGEGSYVGKGIYDVAAFERSLAGQVRQNTLLSHDLFEGIYGRAALVTDIILYEEYPSRYLVYARRLRRWIRGDWQLLPWLFPIVHTENGMAPNRLSIINRLENFRQPAAQPAAAHLAGLLAAGWLFLPGSPLVWTMLVLLPSILPIGWCKLSSRSGTISDSLRLKATFKPTKLPLIRWALADSFSPLRSLAYVERHRDNADPLVHRAKTSAAVDNSGEYSASFGSNTHTKPGWRWRPPWLSPFSWELPCCFQPNRTFGCSPSADCLADRSPGRLLDQPAHDRTSPRRSRRPQRRQVRRLARRTWAFFEQFAGPNDHWLPPDHFQESPLGNVAHYTTPTNIGLFLAVHVVGL